MQFGCILILAEPGSGTRWQFDRSPPGGGFHNRSPRGRRAQVTVKPALSLSPNPPKGWRYSSRMGDEWQRGAMVRTGFRVDGSGGGLQQPRGDLVAVCERWQGEMAGRGRSKRHSRTGVARDGGRLGSLVDGSGAVRQEMAGLATERGRG